MPERRAALAQLRLDGYEPKQLRAMLGFQTITLGALASGVGLLAGDLLSRAAARNPPAYLAFAFPLGTHRVVPVSAIVLAWLGGLLATCLAGLAPLIDVRRGAQPRQVLHEDAEPGQTLSTRTRVWLALTGVLLAAATSLLVLVVPSMALAAIMGIALATVLVIPLMFAVVLRAIDGWAQHWRLNAMVLAVRSVRATPIRALALAATGAVAVFGSVSIEGAHRDLLRGLDHNFADYLNSADIWVTVAGNENGLTTESFPANGMLRRVRAIPSVANARAYYGGLLDTGDRRLWVIGRPGSDRLLIPPSQLDGGDLATATSLVRRGGWAAVSKTVVERQHTSIGGRITLPTPSGTRSYRVAATLTNLGWGPGAAILNAADYRRDWRNPDPSAIEINLKPGASATAAVRDVRAVLGPGETLGVQTTAQRHDQFQRLARQGLTRLSQISTLLLIAVALAIAAAMGAAISQRRVGLARMRIDGFTPVKLWFTLLLEAAIILLIGCLTGALTGIYGHILGAHWLELSTGFPAPSIVGPAQPITTSLLVAAAAVAITGLFGAFAARTPPRLGLQE